MSELKITHDRIRAALVADGAPAGAADHIVGGALEAAAAALKAFAAQANQATDYEWANTYLIGLQLLSLLATEEAENFKGHAARLGMPSGHIGFGAAGDAG